MYIFIYICSVQFSSYIYVYVYIYMFSSVQFFALNLKNSDQTKSRGGQLWQG